LYFSLLLIPEIFVTAKTALYHCTIASYHCTVVVSALLLLENRENDKMNRRGRMRTTSDRNYDIGFMM